MQASFDSQASFAMNPFLGGASSRASLNVSCNRSSPSFGRLAPAPFYPPAPPSFFGGAGNMSRSSYNSSSQQMSCGPNGFSNYFESTNAMSFDRQSPFGNSSYNHFESANYSRQGGYGLNGGFNGGFNGASGSWSDCQRYNPPPPALPDRDCRNHWSDTGVNDGKSSIDLGNYKLDFDKSNSSMMLTNNQSGDKTRIWGDPHIDLNSGTSSQTSGLFNGPLTFSLPDHTNIAVKTQPANGNPGVSFADNVTITQGNRAYTVNGLSQQDGSPLTVQRGQDGFALARQMPQDGYRLFADGSGSGWINGATHQAATGSDFHA